MKSRLVRHSPPAARLGKQADQKTQELVSSANTRTLPSAMAACRASNRFGTWTWRR